MKIEVFEENLPDNIIIERIKKRFYQITKDE